MGAKIIAVYNQKGGCGKTMTSMQLGAALALRGYTTLVVDMDRQGTAAIWSGQATADEPFPARVISLAIQQGQMIGEIRKFVKDHEIIIIDCPPAIESLIPWAALNIAVLGYPAKPLMFELALSCR